MVISRASVLSNKKQEIINSFFTFFSNLNYQVRHEVPLITNDKSLIFTNATIVPWKKYVLGKEIPQSGICAKQSCLRLHVLNDKIHQRITNETNSRRFLGYFNMLGTLTSDSHKSEMISNLFELLTKEFKIPSERIKVFGSKKQNFLSYLDEKTDISYDFNDESYYHWEYGMEGVSGNGATFTLKQPDGSFKEIGQIIQINNSEKNKVYEFGIGLETFLSRMEGFEDYRAWTIHQCVSDRHRFKILLDLYSCFGATMAIDSNLLDKKHKKEIRRLSRRIAKLEDILNINEEETNNSINRFINLEFKKDVRMKVYDELNSARISYQENGKK